MYELRHKTLSLRVPEEPPARLAAVLGLTEALTAALAASDDEIAVGV